MTARLTFTPMGPIDSEIPFVLSETGDVPFRISFTIQAYWALLSTNNLSVDPITGLIVATEVVERVRKTVGGADFMLQWDRFLFFAEAFGGRFVPDSASPIHNFGVWAEAEYVFWGRFLSFGLRGNFLKQNFDIAHDLFYSGEAMLAWYVDAPYLSLRIRYAVGHQENPGGFALGATEGANMEGSVAFPVGFTHLFTVQATLFF
jgi:hypothetical protein